MELPIHGLAWQWYLFAANLLRLFPQQGARLHGRGSHGRRYFCGLLWKYISPWQINSLFPALVYNLIFLAIGLYWGNKKA